MPNLLHLDSSADLRTSRSRSITAAFANTWTALGPDHTVTRRDLHRNPLPHLADADLHWPARLRPAGAAPPAKAERQQQALIGELLAADVLLLGAPLYNYSVPSTLKAWIDNIHVPGLTAPFGSADTQPLKDRPAVIVTSRGGAYDTGTPTAGWDHAVPALQLILGSSLGMSISVITTSLTLAETVPALADQLDRSRNELAAAHREATELAEKLGSA